jgi:hypothetical protein
MNIGGARSPPLVEPPTEHPLPCCDAPPSTSPSMVARVEAIQSA